MGARRARARSWGSCRASSTACSRPLRPRHSTFRLFRMSADARRCGQPCWRVCPFTWLHIRWRRSRSWGYLFVEGNGDPPSSSWSSRATDYVMSVPVPRLRRNSAYHSLESHDCLTALRAQLSRLRDDPRNSSPEERTGQIAATFPMSCSIKAPHGCCHTCPKPRRGDGARERWCSPIRIAVRSGMARTIVEAHDAGHEVVGGSMGLVPTVGSSAAST